MAPPGPSNAQEREAYSLHTNGFLHTLLQTYGKQFKVEPDKGDELVQFQAFTRRLLDKAHVMAREYMQSVVGRELYWYKRVREAVQALDNAQLPLEQRIHTARTILQDLQRK
jgi:hypothetical protein